MEILILTAGKCKNSAFSESIEEYCGRIRHYSKITIRPVKAEPIHKKSDSHRVLRVESGRLLGALPAKHFICALDRTGRTSDSERFAAKMQSILPVRTAMAFIIGGPLGLDKSVIERADSVLSLSKMTFPHELSLLILTEQIYRAFTIINHEKYHK